LIGLSDHFDHRQCDRFGQQEELIDDRLLPLLSDLYAAQLWQGLLTLPWIY
jgi:hypothetical protein